MICECGEILSAKIYRNKSVMVIHSHFLQCINRWPTHFLSPPLGFAGGLPGSGVFSVQTFSSICVWTSWTEPSVSQQSLRLWGGWGSFILPHNAQRFALQCHKRAPPPLPSYPPRRFLEHFQPPGKEPAMRGGKREGRRMRGLDG